MKNKMTNLTKLLACAVIMTSGAFAQDNQNTPKAETPKVQETVAVQGNKLPTEREAIEMQTAERLEAFTVKGIQHNQAELAALIVNQRQRIMDIRQQNEKNNQNTRS